MMEWVEDDDSWRRQQFIQTNETRKGKYSKKNLKEKKLQK
jgi:hypothetical protein